MCLFSRLFGCVKDNALVLQSVALASTMKRGNSGKRGEEGGAEKRGEEKKGDEKSKGGRGEECLLLLSLCEDKNGGGRRVPGEAACGKRKENCSCSMKITGTRAAFVHV